MKFNAFHSFYKIFAEVVASRNYKIYATIRNSSKGGFEFPTL